MLAEGRKKLILASASPRRKEILELLKLDFDIIHPEGAREVAYEHPYRMVTENSAIKARHGLRQSSGRGVLVCGFDTVVYADGRVFGKPASTAEASHFLKKFNGRTHQVITGVCILDGDGRKSVDIESTLVEFRKLGDREIDAYLEAEEVLDKAGAYNISGYGAVLVKRIEGCFYNVAGLPVARFISLLEDFNYKILDS
ncbi:MAG: Maf family protein [Actinomycetota bacterium]